MSGMSACVDKGFCDCPGLLPDNGIIIERDHSRNVRCMLAWNRWNDAFALSMADCAYDEI